MVAGNNITWFFYKVALEIWTNFIIWKIYIYNPNLRKIKISSFNLGAIMAVSLWILNELFALGSQTKELDMTYMCVPDRLMSFI